MSRYVSDDSLAMMVPKWRIMPRNGALYGQAARGLNLLHGNGHKIRVQAPGIELDRQVADAYPIRNDDVKLI